MPSELIHAAQIAWSKDLALTSIHGACERVLGASEEKLLGKQLGVVLGISDQRARQLDAQARKNASPPVVDFVSRADGSNITFRLVLGFENGHACAGVMELHDLLLGAPPLQISALSSSLSHEIRNPLSSVKMAVQTLQRNTGHSDRDKRRLSIANREIRTMERMLGLLSEYGREHPVGSPGTELEFAL